MNDDALVYPSSVLDALDDVMDNLSQVDGCMLEEQLMKELHRYARTHEDAALKQAARPYPSLLAAVTAHTARAAA